VWDSQRRSEGTMMRRARKDSKVAGAAGRDSPASRNCCATQRALGFRVTLKSATIRKIKARSSLLTRCRPPICLTLETHVQYKRNPARCQFTTVLGVSKTRGCLHPDQNVLKATQNSLCRAVNRRRGRCTCRASNCRRRARFSRTRSSRAARRTVGPERDPLMLFVGDAFVRFDFAQRIKMEPLVVRENSIQLFRPNATLLHSNRLASEASLPSS